RLPIPTRYILIYWITNGTAIAITIMITSATIAISIIVNPVSDETIFCPRVAPAPLQATLQVRWRSSRLSQAAVRLAGCHISLHSWNNIPQTPRETTPESSVRRACHKLGNRILSYILGGPMETTRRLQQRPTRQRLFHEVAPACPGARNELVRLNIF